MWWHLGQLLVLTGLIIAVARWLLYDPAKRITHSLDIGHRGAGQILGYLTSVPEFVTAVAIAATGLMATVGYNVLTSNVINVLLALAAAGWFRQMRALRSRRWWPEWGVIALTILAPAALLVTGGISSGWMTVPLLGGYAVYLWWLKRQGTAEEASDAEGDEPANPAGGRRWSLALNIGLIVAALVALYFLGDAVGEVVYTLGTNFGVPEIVLGALIGVATSLPEMTTFFSSYAWHSRKGTNGGTSEVMHNVLASNVSNTVLVISAALVAFLILA